MNDKENMHEVRSPNIYILSYIIYYIVPLTIIIVLAIKVVGFSKVRETLSIISKYNVFSVFLEVWWLVSLCLPDDLISK